MTFHDIRLPDDIERGAVGGPQFKTTVLSLESGFEKRNEDWVDTRGEWDVGYGLMNKADLGINETHVDQLTDFFMARQGRLHSFRFKDFADFQIGDAINPTTDNQQIGIGDDVTVDFQIFKAYVSGPATFNRVITKPTSSVIVLLEGVVQTIVTDYTVDLNTGLVTFVVAPASTGGSGLGGEEIVQIATLFDNHVRFNTDQLQISMEVFNVGSWPNVPILELRGTGV